uniref:GPIanchor transamidase putative n=1 Tax=Albugo laibachii Nc14 TaxID=890382 RepID=F0WEL5_9STRA|nr:GPIanchor transamidase putative [Albugo laibachii Nc14]CCA23079.1 GPIanchor transamidase putative [Albugo laibachii Nc14]|eukprot:CCA23079.1 GPIanchor transamidase putative [Albugo laibachii Nc14]
MAHRAYSRSNASKSNLLRMLLASFAVYACTEDSTTGSQSSTNNWAVVVDTSRFWFNYRHIANALSLYHSVKLMGIPDSQIILMLADQMPCNARNCFPGQVFNSRTQKINLYGKDVEVDYRGAEVTVANFITVLTGRHQEATPASKKLETDENSNIFIFMTGHGGDQFLKFQDAEEISSQDLADAFQDMHVKKRYKKILFMVDTCQAGSLFNAITSPNVATIGSSKVGENSYAHHVDRQLGLSVIDRFTYFTLDYLQHLKLSNSIHHATLGNLFEFYDPRSLLSTPDYRVDLLEQKIDDVPITDMMGSVLQVELHYDSEAYPLEYTVEGVSDEIAKQIIRRWTPFQEEPERQKERKSSKLTQPNQSFAFSVDFMLGLSAMIIIITIAAYKMV